MKSFFKQIVTVILTWQAKVALKRYRAKLVGITGTVGKTSTKDAVADVLATSFRVRKSNKSFNSEVGVPLAVLDLPNGWSSPVRWFFILLRGFLKIIFVHKAPDWIVLELGVDGPGDMIRNNWLSLDYVIFTQFGETPVHASGFTSREQHFVEKLEMTRLLKENGVAFVNSDDSEFSDAVIELLPGVEVIRYGFLDPTDVKSTPLTINYNNGTPVGVSFEILADHYRQAVTLNGVLGEQLAYPVLAALALTRKLKLDSEKVVEAMSAREFAPGRMRILPGIKESVIIDDTYNSSPLALERAFSIIRRTKREGRLIVVLGDMLELGDYTQQAHERLGELSAYADLLIYTGAQFEVVAGSAREHGMPEEAIIFTRDAEEAGKVLQQYMRQDDFVLVKGSQGTRLEKAVKEVMLDPLRADKLLVRQEKDWLKKK